MDLKNVPTLRCLTGDLQGNTAEKGIVVTIALSAHWDLEAMLGKALLIFI